MDAFLPLSRCTRQMFTWRDMPWLCCIMRHHRLCCHGAEQTIMVHVPRESTARAHGWLTGLLEDAESLMISLRLSAQEQLEDGTEQLG